MRILLSVFFLLAMPALAQDARPRPAEIAPRAVAAYIQPAFADFAARAGALRDEVAALCETPDAARLDATRASFLATVEGFARVSFLRFGPLVIQNRYERLFLWPDPRGIVLRQVQALLAEAPPDALDVAGLQKKSAALQGFTALEFVLSGAGAEALATDPPQGYRCRYGAAVAGAMAQVAGAAAAEWHDGEGIAARLAAPKLADPDYRTVREALEELVGSLAHGAEGVRDTQLLPFLGRDGAAARPRSAPLWRSNATPVLVVGALGGMVDFVAASGIAEGVEDEDGALLAPAFAAEAGRIATARAAIVGSVEAALADPVQLAAYEQLVAVSQSLQALAGDGLATALGLSVGFSSLDGD